MTVGGRGFGNDRLSECQLYFWILKSYMYQHGTKIGEERDSRPKRTTAWTWNVAEEFGMRLRLCAWVCVCVRGSAFACVGLRLRACVCVWVCASAFVCVRLRVSAHRKLNVRTHLDAKGSLLPDASFVRRRFE